MKAFMLYAAACLISVALVGAVAFALVEPGAVEALAVSAGLAVLVQLAAFGLALGFRRRHLMLGWGMGSGLRALALVAYALVVARVWEAPLAPALLSFAAFLFVTTLIEPVFLKHS